MLWLHIHFPNLALEAAFLGDIRPIPKLLLQPGKQTVVQCNDAAIAQGVRIGMNKKTAFCLLADCAIAEYDSKAEHSCLRQLALQCYHQSAQISLIEPQGLLLEIGSMLPLFNGLQAYWQSLHLRLTECPHQFVMATGHTPTSARILARAGISLCHSDPIAIQQALLQLNVSQLDLPTNICQRLQAMGIQSYGALRNTPRKELGYRFGKELVEHLHRLEHDSQPAISFSLPARFQQTVHLNYEAEHARGLIFPLRRILANLEAYLISRQSVCEKLLIKLEHRDGRASLLSIASVRGCYRQAQWLTLLQNHLEHTQLIDPVVSLTLRAKGFIHLQAEHKDLIGGRHLQSDADQMHSLLLARLGEQQVKRVKAEADPRPEAACLLKPSTQAGNEHFLRQWPSLLLPEPKPIQIERYQLVSGPERIEGGWWQQELVRRDYYRARHQQQTVWLFRRDDGQWFLQGYFA